MSAIIFVKRLKQEASLPRYNHQEDAGMDLYSCEKITIPPMERGIVKTGIAIQVVDHITPLEKFINWLLERKFKYEIKIEDTSGNALKKGITHMGGVIDELYRGQIGVIIFNTKNVPVEINVGDKIAQAVVRKNPWVDMIIETDDLSLTTRGEKGFGSSGIIGDKK